MIDKKFQLKNDKGKANNNYKNKDQNYIAIEKLNSKGWNWKTNIQNNIYIYSNQKFEDQIRYNQQIIWHF